MPKKKHKPEEIINKLREAELAIAQGKTVPEVCKIIGVTDQTYYRWRKEYSGMSVQQAKKLKELEKENARLKGIVADQAVDISILKEAARGKLLSAARKRRFVEGVTKKLQVSERRACRAVEISRSSYRYAPKTTEESSAIEARVVELASMHGRYGYRMVTGLMRNEGWLVNHKRVRRIWRKHGLLVPQKQKKRGRLWMNDGSCIRLRPERRNHVWSYDFVSDQTHDGRKLKMLTVIDEYSRECLAIVVERRLRSPQVLDVLYQLFLSHGIPDNIRSDNGPEFTAKAVRRWLSRLGVHTAFIEPGSPWENGYNESFNGTLRYNLLNGEIFYTLYEAKVLIERWRMEYNTYRPHSALGYKPPAPEALRMPALSPWPRPGAAA